MKNSVKISLFCLLSVAFISCDRVTKNIAKEQLKNQPSISYLHDTFRLEYAENTGAALNLGDSLPATASFWLLSILPLAIMLGLFAYTVKNARQVSFMKVFSLALIFSGGIGNISDRIAFNRHVTDFMILNFKSLHTGIFNVADMCITAGAIGLLLFYNDGRNKNTVPAW